MMGCNNIDITINQHADSTNGLTLACNPADLTIAKSCYYRVHDIEWINSVLCTVIIVHVVALNCSTTTELSISLYAIATHMQCTLR